jgi:uncharacterized DUF497 family protein
MVRFEWDEVKAASNVRKHRVRFDDAMLVFGDRFSLIEQDRVVGEEQRWQALGWPGGNFLLMVARAVRTEGEDEIIRIISARKANRKERERYDENRAKELSR